MVSKIPVLLILHIFIPFLLTAQDNLDKYFQDDNTSKPSSVLMWNASAICAGDASISLELKVKPNFYLEGGIGLMLPYYGLSYTNFLIHFLDYEPVIISNGISLYIEPKFYYYSDAPFGRYVGLYARNRKRPEFNTLEIGFLFGRKVSLGGHWFYDISAGGGYHRSNFDPVYRDFDLASALISLKFGRTIK
jgi:hypothetical protein